MSLLAGTAYVDVLPNTSKFGSTLQGKLNGIGSSMQSMGKKLTTRLTLPLIAFGTAAVAEASEAAVVAKQTEAALKSSGNAAVLTATQVEAVGTAISKMAAIDDEAAQKTANLLLSMTDLGRYGAQADTVLQQMTETVYNMAAQTGRSESSFVRLMATVQNAPSKAIPTLLKLGVITEKQAEQYKDMIDDGKGAAVSTQLLAAAEKRFAGAAKAAATPQQRLQVALANLSETIGTVLLPYVNKIIRSVQGWIEKFQNLSPEVQRIVTFVGLLLAALGPLLYVMGTVAKAINGIIGLAVKLGSVFSFLAAHPIVLVLMAIALIAFLIIKNWDKVKAFFVRLWGEITSVFNRIKASITNTIGAAAQWVTDRWNAVVNFFKGLPGKVASAFGRVKDAIVNAFKAAVNFVIGAWNALDFGIHVTAPDWLKYVPFASKYAGKTFGVDDIFPDIPYLAKGGVIRQPTLAMVGESGPEAVVPLSRLAGSEAKLTITDWRRGIGTLEYELDRLALVRGD